MENEEEIVRIFPGDPGYEEAQQDLVDSCPDNRPFSLKECLQYTENNIETMKRDGIHFDFTLDEEGAVFTPAQEFLAKEMRIKMELEQMITEAEAKEPGSTEPPVPTEEEKKFYEIKKTDEESA